MPRAASCAEGRTPWRHPRIAMVAGETSGDLLAGLLIDGMQAHWPGLQSCGIGGPQMQRRGFAAWWPSEKLAVHGYSMEVLRRLRGGCWEFASSCASGCSGSPGCFHRRGCP